MNYEILRTQLSKLQEFNLRLKNLEIKLLPEVITLDKQLKARVEDKNDFLHDYEIELTLSFYLLESDEKYRIDEDNIIASIDEYQKGISSDVKTKSWRLDDNHNEFMGRKEHPMQGEYHCWWFHCLYDHNHIEFEDMLRIGIIWSDIKVHYQYIDIKN